MNHFGSWNKLQPKQSQNESFYSSTDGSKRSGPSGNDYTKPLLKPFTITDFQFRNLKSLQENEKDDNSSKRFIYKNNCSNDYKIGHEEEKESLIGNCSKLDRKFCGKCSRHYSPAYFPLHTCKKQYKCGICCFVSVNPQKVKIHKIKTHLKHQSGFKVSRDLENNQFDVLSKSPISKTANSNQDQYENGNSTNQLSNQEYVSYSLKNNSSHLQKKKCRNCKRSYSMTYFRYHRCIKRFKCELCPFTNVKLEIVTLHRQFSHPDTAKEMSGVSCLSNVYRECAAQEKPSKELPVKSMKTEVHGFSNVETYESNSMADDCSLETDSAPKNINYSCSLTSMKNSKMKCPQCPFEGKSKRGLDLHRYRRHFVQKSILMGKKLIDLNRFKCQHCNKKFQFRSQLKLHMKAKHNGFWLRRQDHQQNKSTNVAENILGNYQDLCETPFKLENCDVSLEGSSSCSVTDSKGRDKAKRTCILCYKNYHPSYLPYHRCPMKTTSTDDHPDQSSVEISSIDYLSNSEKSQKEELNAQTDKSENTESTWVCSGTDLSEAPTSYASELTDVKDKEKLKCYLCHKSYIPKYLPFHKCLATSINFDSNERDNFTQSSGTSVNCDKSMNGNGKIKCEKCQATYNVEFFQQHLCTKIFKCDDCSFTTNCKEKSKLHKQIHLTESAVVEEDSLIKCKSCHKKFVSQRWFKHHKINECEKKPQFECSHCHKKFHQKNALLLHIIKTHKHQVYK